MKSYRAIIVEDDKDISFIFAEALRTLGFEVEVIADGGKGLSRLAEVAPHLLILDMHLPHISGINLLRQIHTEPRLMPTRVIVATADPVLKEELEGQADRVFLKPVSFNMLQEAAVELVPGVLRNKTVGE
jgi:two-component system, cell cycle response regulator DivK